MNLKYPILIRYSAEDECSVAQIVGMPGIMAHGDTPLDAMREVSAALELALEVYAEDGITPPPPPSANAMLLGRMGGSSRSRAKRLAAKANGAKGGRPRTTPTPPSPARRKATARA